MRGDRLMTRRPAHEIKDTNLSAVETVGAGNRGVPEMKITVEVDCTPIEARKFFGLPDVEPLQASMMAKLEERISEEMNRFSPEALMKSWFSLFPQNAEWVQKIFENVVGGTKRIGLITELQCSI
jgi:hypothetical protein